MTEIWYASIFGVACVLVIPLAIAAQRVGATLAVVDRPRQGENQPHEVPRTGGYAVFLAFWVAVLLSFLVSPAQIERLSEDNYRLIGVLLGSMVLLPFALVDDVRRLGPVPQLLGQAAAAIVPVVFGVRMEEVATPFGPLAVPDALAGPLAALWIIGMINAINLLDGMDGLASGVVVIASTVLLIRTTWFDQASIAVLPLALAGSCFGFLTQNWHPSRVILGTSGSYFLGYMLGVITLVGGAKIGTAFLVLAVPILDVAWVIYRRIAQGRSPFRGGDSEHLAHRLRMLGLSDRRIVLAVYAVCGGIGAAVLAMHSAIPTTGKAYLAGLVSVGVLGSIALIGRLASARAATRERINPTPEESRETR